MPTVKIKDKLYNEISEFCKINSIPIVEYVNEKLKAAIINDKYGDIPFGVIPFIKEGPVVMDYKIPPDENIESLETVTPIPGQSIQDEKQEEKIATNNSKTTTNKKRRL
jgi:hypothetical protein